MSDIIERLREMAPKRLYSARVLMVEAADELARTRPIVEASIKWADDMLLCHFCGHDGEEKPHDAECPVALYLASKAGR